MNNIKCLVTVPADDINFKSALGYASIDELKEAEKTLDYQYKVGLMVKTKLAAVRREIRHRGRNSSVL